MRTRTMRRAGESKDQARAGLSLCLLCLLCLLCILCVLCAAAAAAQIIGSSRTALALVDDPRTRRPIIDLGADDFVVQEGNEARDVLSVRPADYPVLVMIDAAGPEEDLPLVVKAARRFIE